MQIFFIHLELVYSFIRIDCRIMIYIALNHKPFFDWKVSTISNPLQIVARDAIGGG